MSTDSLNVLSSVNAFPQQCSQVLTDLAEFSVPSEYLHLQNIVISGMGGSALGGRILASLERQVLKVPLFISTQYHLPNFVDQNTLVIASSYSGNTEETLSSLDEAFARNAKVIILASGGKLAEIAEQKRVPKYIFTPSHNPSGQPRMALGYNIIGLLRILSVCDLMHDQGSLADLASFLTSKQKDPQIESLATTLLNKIPVLVSSEHLQGAAIAFRNQINENAKCFATYFDLPELNHHLMEGLTHPTSNSQNLCFVLVESDKYHPRIKKRYQLTKQLLAKQNIPTVSFSVSAISTLYETLQLVQAGAAVAYALSQKEQTDPGPIPWVDWFKDEMAKSTN